MKIFTHLTTLLTGLVFAVGTAWADVPFSTTTLLADETSTNETTITVSASTGSFTKSNNNGNWHSEWQSTATDPQITINCGYNNMATNGDNITAFVGNQVSSQDYTITCSSNYIITGYTFNFKMTASNSITVSGGDQEIESTSEDQTLTVTGLTSSTATFNLSGDNYGVELSNFVVTLTHIYPLLQDAIETAKTALNTRGVGYPTTESSAYTALQSAITTAEALTEETVTEDALTTLETAITTYKSETTDIQMPEDGKAYTFTNVRYGGDAKYYLNHTSGAYVPTLLADGATIPVSAYFICRKISDGVYVFVNNDGKYLKYLDASNNAGSDAYDATYSPIHVEKLVHGSYVAPANEDLFGYMAIYAYKESGDNEHRYIVIRGNGAYDGATAPFFNANSSGVRYSSAFLIEEVSYPNTVTLNSTGGTIPGAEYLGTFSAPFPTVIPTDVTAYYVGSTTETTNENAVATAELVQIETAIPANTGVILASDTETSATMVPVTTEEVATISESANLLGNSAGADLTIGDNYYILSKTDTYGVGFYLATSGTTLSMNKSYLNYSGTSAAVALNFNGKSTDITNATSNASENAPVYDLSGRRVQKTVKGGLYISNGKKFIVK